MKFPVKLELSAEVIGNCLCSALEGGSGYWCQITRGPDGVGRGLQVMAEKYPRHFGNLISDNDDAETGDVLLQCSVLGEIVYG